MSRRPGSGRLVAVAVLAAGSLVTGTAVAAESMFTQAPPPVVGTGGAVLVVDLPAGVSPERCTVDGVVVEPAACSRGGLVVNGLDEGPHTAAVQVPGEPEPRTASWRVDTTAPTLRVLQAPRGWLRTSTAVVRFSGADTTGLPAALRFWCSHQASGCDAGGRAVFRLPGEGRHTWTVHVSDRAGNLGSGYGTVGVDLRAPSQRPSHRAGRVTEARTSPLRWNLTDAASGIVRVDARLRTADRVGPWSRWRYPPARQGTGSAPQALRTPRGGSTACLQVRAADRVGRRSAWGRAVCRAGFVDVARVDRTGRWRSLPRDRTWLARTAHVTTRRGARLTVGPGRGVAAVGVRARTGPGQGRLRVSAGDRVLVRIDLDRRRRGLRGFVVPVPAGATDGPVQVTVTSAGAPVWIDGVGVLRRLPG